MEKTFEEFWRSVLTINPQLMEDRAIPMRTATIKKLCEQAYHEGENAGHLLAERVGRNLHVI